jgi:hypothetical protein
MLEVVIFVCSMAQLPESSFEKMSVEARAKERLDRQKMLVSLLRSKVEQEYLALVAAKVVDLRERTSCWSPTRRPRRP